MWLCHTSVYNRLKTAMISLAAYDPSLTGGQTPQLCKTVVSLIFTLHNSYSHGVDIIQLDSPHAICLRLPAQQNRLYGYFLGKQHNNHNRVSIMHYMYPER